MSERDDAVGCVRMEWRSFGESFGAARAFAMTRSQRRNSQARGGLEAFIRADH